MTRAREPAAVLGLWDGHDAGVALVADGQLVFALSEERPSRRKRHSGFPRLALTAALEWAGAHGLRVTDVAVGGRFGRAPLRLAERWYAAGDPHRDPLVASSVAVRAWENALPRVPALREVERVVGLAAVASRVTRMLGTRPRLHAIPHHDAHAASAVLAGAEDDAFVLTWDAYGEGLAATWRPAAAAREASRALPVSAGVALLYGAVTVALGFREGDEGKVMGLAASGDARRAEAVFRDLFELTDGAPALKAPLTRAAVLRCVAGLSREDAAAGLQRATERLVTGWVRTCLAQARGEHLLLLAGGLFANIRVNQALATLPGVRGVRVFAAMGDGGLAAGAAAAAWAALTGAGPEPIRHVYLGREFDAARLESAARASGLPWRRVADPAGSAARRLVAGQVVARFDGRDEFGPRALGNRSLLFHARHAGLADRVNAALRRDAFMPFGPSVPAEAAPPLWHGVGDSDLATMTLSVDATRSFRLACPTAVHVDGTSRPQVVTSTTNPSYHALLTAVHRLSGQPAVINTSFNLHGEPIVHTPEDALRTFATAGFEALYLGDLEVRRPDVA